MEFTLSRPDDWHLHLRDGAALADVVPHSAARFGRAIVMPNLSPPVADTRAAAAYRQRILAAVPPGCAFQPLMTLYLTEATPPEEIDLAMDSGLVYGVKLYPAGATTHSGSGVTDIGRVTPVLERMQRLDLPLLVHGEVVDPEVDIFDREQVFIDRHLSALTRDFPELRIVLEHVTTAEAVDFVAAGGRRLAATITAHHLLYNRNAMLAGGIRPHYYCLPVIKRERHRRALLAAATGGNPKFFLGTDSAPHARAAKQSDCGCAGIFSAHAAIELYAEAFEGAGALDRLEGFAAHHGADFYGLPRNPERITLAREPWAVPRTLPFGDQDLVPLRAGESCRWRLRPGPVA